LSIENPEPLITPTLILTHQGGEKYFRELDVPQLCCGVLHKKSHEDFSNFEHLSFGILLFPSD
jgi:hypothetical protein